MAISNPTKYVTIRRLNRFRQKLKAETPSVATVAESEAAANELT